jgi:hypothetical protein
MRIHCTHYTLYSYTRFPQMPVSRLKHVASVCAPEPHMQYSEVEVR